MTKYVCGFFFNEQKTHVVLIWKEKPVWQKGKLNGVGGKIEGDEIPLAAMVREFKEETGLNIYDWERFITLQGLEWEVNFFVCIDTNNYFEYAETKEQEEVAKIEVDRLDDFNYIPNLRWLIPLALHKLNFPEEKFIV